MDLEVFLTNSPDTFFSDTIFVLEMNKENFCIYAYSKHVNSLKTLKAKASFECVNCVFA